MCHRVLYIPVIISILSLSGCKMNSATVPTFDLIDVSVSNGWGDYYCIKVNDSGFVHIYNDIHERVKTYFTLTLDKIELDSVCKLSEVVLNSKPDTLYYGRCVDCGSFNLIIKSKGKVIRCHVNGINSHSKEYSQANSLVMYLNKLAEKSKRDLESEFIYESRTKFFYSLPPPPLVGTSKN
jgi:hypothetical protein